MNTGRVELDGKKRKLLLRGGCAELLPICSAACCREWRVEISIKEYETGMYEAEQRCLLTDKTCERKRDACHHKAYQLKKKIDGACINLDDESRCRIYENRPKVCVDFTCKGGWRLGAVAKLEDDGKNAGLIQGKAAFIEKLRDNMVFVSHPLIKLHTVFFVKAKGEIIFVKEMVGRCGKFQTRDNLHGPELSDDLFLALFRLFDRKDTLHEIYRRFCDQYAVSLSKSDFAEILWLLNKHNIVLAVNNFNGMLAGMGSL